MTASRRRSAPPSSIGPLLVLAALALVPTAVLWSTWQWADAKAQSFDAAPPPPTTLVPPPDPAPPLATPLASLRRVPQALSYDLNLDAFRAAVVPLLDSVNDRSCVSVSVDGIDVGARNEATPVIPASVQKLTVAAAALEILGDEFRYTTTAVGEVGGGGVVAGDLTLVGGGDPLLSGDWYPTSNMERFPVFDHTSLDTLADRIVAAGVTRVEGNVIGDGSRYDDELFAPGWAVGVAGLEAGPYTALLVNDSRVLGDDLRASDPREAAARELLRLLGDRGVAVGGEAVAGVAPAGATEIASIESVPLPGVLAEMLANSDNNTAEMLVKELGVATSDTGTRPAGLEAIRTVLTGWDLDLTGVVLADGSGLSLDNILTCQVVIGVLQRFGTDDPIAAGLPVAGQSGTLRDVFIGGPVDGRLLGKTGTLNNPPFNEDPPAVKALAGYLPVEGGGAVEYSLLLNGPTISDQSEYRPVWDLLAQVLASYPSAAGPDVLGPR